jgi:transcriptional regulator of met regulon
MLKVVVRVRKDEWKGEVVDKIYNEKIERDPEFSKIEKRMPLYTLVIKTNEGIERKVAVTKDMFESCKIGDKFIKEKGSLNPRKLND